MVKQKIRILLVEDDEDDFILVRSRLHDASSNQFEMDWASTFEEGLDMIVRSDYDVYLVDYRLGDRTGLELLTEAIERGCKAPIILLTGQGDYSIDIEAMKSGAADYLVKDEMSPALLERTIRYAIESKQAHAQIVRYHDQLEDLVKERTAQLEAANKSLRLEIAERQKAEVALRESERRYRELADLLPQSVFEFDVDRRLIFVNRTGFDSFGYTEEDLKEGLDALQFIVAEERQKAKENIVKRIKGEISGGSEYTMRHKDGGTFPAIVFSTPIVHDGKLAGLRGIIIDISAIKEAEAKIIQQNIFLNHVLESLTHPFCVIDANNYEVLRVNSAAIKSQENENITCHALIHRSRTVCNASEENCPLALIRKTKKPVTVEHVHKDKDGIPRNVEVHAYPIFDDQGNVVQMIEYSFDITKRKKMEEELRRNAEKIKIFAYSVSHDLKSPMIGIHGLTSLLHKQYRNLLDKKGQKYMDQVLKASKQALALIEEINVYIRTKEAPLNIEEIQPKEILQMIHDEFGAILGIRQIDWIEPEIIPAVKADRLSIMRVFRNLVDNALKYGGDPLNEIRIEYSESESSHIFAVRDNGVGIKGEACDKIFGIFQRHATSKGTEGAGLGLAIVKETAKKHAGDVWVEPGQENGGTVFYISISKNL